MTLRETIRAVATGPTPRPPTAAWFSAVLLEDTLSRPWRVAGLVAVGTLLAWLSGYDVR